MAAAVSPNGTILLVDLIEERGLAERPYDSASWLLRTRIPISRG
jgi:hypothetical protein